MKRYIFILFFFLAITDCQCQISDDFSDGDFSSNPTWQGDVESFIINTNNELQLVGNERNEAYLHLGGPLTLGDIEWTFRIRLNLAPSGSNYARVYLLSTGTSAEAPSAGAYYLQFGEALNNDAIELFYGKDTLRHSICRGENGKISLSFDYNVKVIKRGSHWNIYVDEARAGDYVLEAEGDYGEAAWYPLLGLYCKFTGSNSNRFIFDDFYLGAPQIDTLPPHIEMVSTGNDLRKIEVQFSENTASVTSLLSSNYRIIENGWHPAACTIVGTGCNRLALTFAHPFAKGETYHIECQNIHDAAGNFLPYDTAQFCWSNVQRNDVVISEIMADPYPKVGLAECEYVEIHNRTNAGISLQGWKFQYGGNYREIGDYSIGAGADALIVQSGQEGYFASGSEFIPIITLNLTDGGQQLALWDNYGELIHSVNFKREWHQEVFKRDGGWSLEMIDTENPCSGEENWGSSEALTGGTPGERNSIANENPDLTEPELTHVTVPDSVTLQIHFDEPLVTDSSRLRHAFQIAPCIEITSIRAVGTDGTMLACHLATALAPQQRYTITVVDTLRNCSGLSVRQGGSVQFGLPTAPQQGDIVINEVLSNPPGTTDADYIEIYNRSNTIIDLKEVRIGSGGMVFPEKSCAVSSEGYLLFPQEHLAICKNKKLTLSQYWCPEPQRLLQCDSLPGFANATGIVHLTTQQYQPLDLFCYEEEMHYSLLTDYDGVSLERIHYDRETQSASNWKSAAASAGFGTPGMRNSQFAETAEAGGLLQISPAIFSPDNDGFDDFTTLQCQFTEPETRVTLNIFNKNGLIIKQIANNQLCGQEATFLWDGTTEKGNLSPPDLYIVSLAYWTENGKSKQIKKIVGVARK